MRVCPKCQRTVADESKICRVCGSILDEMLEPDSPQAFPAGTEPEADSRFPAECVNLSDLADLPLEIDESDLQRWICPTCQEVVEHNFDLCWNCGTDRQAVSDQHSICVVQEGEQPEGAQDRSESELNPAGRSCIRCGSQRIVPEATVYDQGQGSDTKLYAMVVGNPDAVIFRDRMFVEILAEVCGDCGHVELKALDAEKLYQHYLGSLK